MEENFERFLSPENTLGYAPLASAVCAFQTVESICDKNFKEEEEEGKKLYVDFLNFCIKIYTNTILKYSKSEIEVKLKAFEVKNFVFNTMIEDLILDIAKHCGTEELVEIFQSDLEIVKIKDLSNLLRLMYHEKSLADEVSDIFERDFQSDKMSLITKLVSNKTYLENWPCRKQPLQSMRSAYLDSIGDQSIPMSSPHSSRVYGRSGAVLQRFPLSEMHSLYLVEQKNNCSAIRLSANRLEKVQQRI